MYLTQIGKSRQRLMANISISFYCSVPPRVCVENCFPCCSVFRVFAGFRLLIELYLQMLGYLDMFVPELMILRGVGRKYCALPTIQYDTSVLFIF